MTILAHYFEEIEIGTKYALGDQLFETDMIKTFAAAYDPQPFHMDEDAAKKSHFGRLCASGWQTAACWMKAYVDFNMALRKERETAGHKLPEIGVSPGIEQIKWARPVYVGDTISFSLEVIAKRPLKSRPGWGLVSSLSRGYNQDGELAISFVSKTMVQMNCGSS